MMNNFHDDLTEITIREGEHRGEQQLYGEANGYKYVLRPYKKLRPRVGERWEVRYQHSPNGHIVFCTPVRRVEKTDEHPLVQALKPYYGHGVTRTIPRPVNIHIIAEDPRTWTPTVLRGTLLGCKVKYGNVVLNIDGHEYFYDEWEFTEELRHRFGKSTCTVYDERFSMRIDITFWK